MKVSKYLNGFKTYIGFALIGIGEYYSVKNPLLAEILKAIGYGMAGYGVKHKVDKFKVSKKEAFSLKNR